MLQARCRVCRCILLDDENLLAEHEARSTKPLDLVLKDYRSGGSNIHAVSCTHLFTQELPWMEPFIRDTPEGLINCPKCEGKLGNFSWVGVRCSCGAWMVPGFAFLRSKIDIFKNGKI